MVAVLHYTQLGGSDLVSSSPCGVQKSVVGYLQKGVCSCRFGHLFWRSHL